MNKTTFYFWMGVIALISVFTGEIVTFMMLFLILVTLKEINQILMKFYDDWKDKN
ncbi:hypothetical protein QNH20_12260 [Neobacillus sp. WH10]|uniref:hypothetical protein n=1 Tax=Neobacillus sp. WH10 TaxID=3047873 RepID=UPI0024C16804|nr:hypothetical protein [Neobacillus sp. WH10]WHY79866.1 hypothetical protein QNH20_12260 [Neobacillus sp. WH10]